jgi:hypothetical protein
MMLWLRMSVRPLFGNRLSYIRATNGSVVLHAINDILVSMFWSPFCKTRCEYRIPPNQQSFRSFGSFPAELDPLAT